MQRTLSHTGHIRYWVLIVSVAAHAIALGVFTGIKLTAPAVQADPQRPAVSMEMIQKAVERPKPKPKPKVEPIAKIEKHPVEPEKTPLVIPEEIPIEAEPVSEPDVVEEVVPEVVESMPAPVIVESEFFGQKSIVQRVCFVVDCSGSMYGQMYRIKSELKKYIQNLNSEQAFATLFFMEGQQILMSGPGRLELATAGAKSEAIALVDKIGPGGSTDAAHALECAMRLRSPDGKGPEVIYFLTDGFNLDQGSAVLFIEKIERFRKSLAPSAVIHTIGFWPQKTDKRMLKLLAKKSGGSYIEGIK